MGEATTLDGIPEIEEIQDSIIQSFNRFKNFDVTYAQPHDHHFSVYPKPIDRQFLGGFRRANAIDQSDQLRKKIEQEHEILRDNLSNSIFVRAYEGRRELMRVLIIGSKGTHLAHHLFFFDILFPRVYPSKPPFIFDHYSNSCLDLNRGLLYDTNYIDGLKFKWDPQTSNIYHMLEFIQGYVLRLSKIYANDDERDFLVSHNALLGILRSPPKEFEDFVKGYFRKSAHAILMSMKLTGNLSESEAKTKLYFELLEAFEANGSYCKHLRHGIESIRSSFPQQKINNGDVFVVKMFKCALSKTEACMCWLCGNRQYCSIS